MPRLLRGAVDAYGLDRVQAVAKQVLNFPCEWVHTVGEANAILRELTKDHKRE